MAHTPKPWKVEPRDSGTSSGLSDALAPEWAFTIMVPSPPFALGATGAAVISEADAELIALAPTAPHDCDLPSCPGQANKRKLEAAEKLLAALRDAHAYILNSYLQDAEQGEVIEYIESAIEAYERGL